MSKCYYCGGRGRGCPECKRVVEARTMTGEFSPENQAAGGKNVVNHFHSAEKLKARDGDGTWENLVPNSYYADDNFNDTWTYAAPQPVKNEFSLEQLKATMDQINREVPVQPDLKPWKNLVMFGGDPFAADPLQKLAEQIARYNAARREEAFLAFYSGLFRDNKD